MPEQLEAREADSAQQCDRRSGPLPAPGSDIPQQRGKEESEQHDVQWGDGVRCAALTDDKRKRQHQTAPSQDSRRPPANAGHRGYAVFAGRPVMKSLTRSAVVGLNTRRIR